MDATARASWTRPPGVPVRVPPHPGRFLERNCLRPLRLTQVEAARLLGMSRRRVHEIVQGQRGISADTAVRCALMFGIDTAFWLALQANWDSFRAWDQLRRARAVPRAPRLLLVSSPR
ncbi:MAG: HigA family addiction module antidote protein [Burkholderiales bacterium]|nr:HigA family addiction module antidote protein [Burkholderiales bacterium]